MVYHVAGIPIIMQTTLHHAALIIINTVTRLTNQVCCNYFFRFEDWVLGFPLCSEGGVSGKVSIDLANSHGLWHHFKSEGVNVRM